MRLGAVAVSLALAAAGLLSAAPRAVADETAAFGNWSLKACRTVAPGVQNCTLELDGTFVRGVNTGKDTFRGAVRVTNADFFGATTLRSITTTQPIACKPFAISSTDLGQAVAVNVGAGDAHCTTPLSSGAHQDLTVHFGRLSIAGTNFRRFVMNRGDTQSPALPVIGTGAGELRIYGCFNVEQYHDRCLVRLTGLFVVRSTITSDAVEALVDVSTKIRNSYSPSTLKPVGPHAPGPRPTLVCGSWAEGSGLASLKAGPRCTMRIGAGPTATVRAFFQEGRYVLVPGELWPPILDR